MPLTQYGVVMHPALFSFCTFYLHGNSTTVLGRGECHFIAGLFCLLYPQQPSWMQESTVRVTKRWHSEVQKMF